MTILTIIFISMDLILTKKLFNITTRRIRRNLRLLQSHKVRYSTWLSFVL